MNTTFTAILILLTVQLTVSGQVSISGNYTINKNEPTGGTNFNSFSELKVQLDMFGINGPLVVDVVVNNIIRVTSEGGANKYAFYFQNTTGVLESDHNAIFVTGTNAYAGKIYLSNYSSLNNWQTATGFDSNSVFANPQFLANPPPMPQNAAINNMGKNLLSIVPFDIDGNERTTTPDPGAREFNPDCLTPVVNWAWKNESEYEFLLYPIPASNKLFLQSGMKPGDLLQILVYDVHGNLVLLLEKPDPNKTHVLEVGHLPKDVYIIQLKGRSLFLSGKFAVI